MKQAGGNWGRWLGWAAVGYWERGLLMSTFVCILLGSECSRVNREQPAVAACATAGTGSVAWAWRPLFLGFS